MILVAGATGLLGREICGLLLDRKKLVRAMVRRTSNPELVADLKRRGAESIEADLKNPKSLDAACKSIDTVVSTVSSTFSRQEGDSIETVDRQGNINLIDAARRAGVRRFVFVSFDHQNAPVPAPLTEAKKAAEQHLMRSGMEYTILHASFFMEVWLSPALGFDSANGKATIYGSGTNAISWISLFDVAAFAAASVDHTAAKNRIIGVCGPEAIPPLDLVKIFENVTGRHFDVQHVPEEALRAQREGATDPMQQSFASLMLSYAAGVPIDISQTAKQFSIPLRSVRDYARGFLVR